MRCGPDWLALKSDAFGAGRFLIGKVAPDRWARVAVGECRHCLADRIPLTRVALVQRRILMLCCRFAS